MEPVHPTVRSRKKVALATVAVLVVSAVVIAVLSREHLIVKRFAVVEPGQVFRGGYAKPWPLKRMIEKHGVKQILCLLDYRPHPASGPASQAIALDNAARQQQRLDEQKVALETGAVIEEIPMPGNGCASFHDLDRAADIVADPARRPLYVHCAAGVQRTGAVIAAYRMKHQGWSLKQALEEAEQHGLNRRKNPELYEHLQRYAVRLEGASEEDHVTDTAPTSGPS